MVTPTNRSTSYAFDESEEEGEEMREGYIIASVFKLCNQYLAIYV